MITKNNALLSCIELLNELEVMASNDMTMTIAACIQQAKEAIATPFECPPLSIMGPDRITIHPEAYTSLDELVRAAASFPLRFVHQGYYAGTRGRLAIHDIPDTLTVIIDEADDEDAAARADHLAQAVQAILDALACGRCAANDLLD